MSDNKPKTEQLAGWENIPTGNIQGMFMNETVICANELYDNTLVSSGQVKSLNEAKGVQRNLSCSCPKCKAK